MAPSALALVRYVSLRSYCEDLQGSLTLEMSYGHSLFSKPWRLRIHHPLPKSHDLNAARQTLETLSLLRVADPTSWEALLLLPCRLITSEVNGYDRISPLTDLPLNMSMPVLEFFFQPTRPKVSIYDVCQQLFPPDSNLLEFPPFSDVMSRISSVRTRGLSTVFPLRFVFPGKSESELLGAYLTDVGKAIEYLHSRIGQHAFVSDNEVSNELIKSRWKLSAIAISIMTSMLPKEMEILARIVPSDTSVTINGLYLAPKTHLDIPRGRMAMRTLLTTLFDSHRKTSSSRSKKTSDHRLELNVNCNDATVAHVMRLFSAVMTSKKHTRLHLSHVFNDDVAEVRALKWKWLAYACFHRSNSSNRSIQLELDGITIQHEDVDAMEDILNSSRPLNHLMHSDSNLSYQTYEAQVDHTTVFRPIALYETATDHQQRPDNHQLETISLGIQEPIWIPVFKTDTSEWISALVPGYGLCQVREDSLVAMETYTETESGNIHSTSALFINAETDDIDASVVERLLSLIGRPLQSLSIQLRPDERQALNMEAIQTCCPQLRHLSLENVQIRSNLLAFYNSSDSQLSHLSLSNILVDNLELEKLAVALSNKLSVVARTLQELILRFPSPRNDDALPSFDSMLDTNSKLHTFFLYFDHDRCERFTPLFKRHNGDTIATRQEELAYSSKLAFLSVMHGSNTSLATLDVEVIQLIFAFAATNGHRKVWMMPIS